MLKSVIAKKYPDPFVCLFVLSIILESRASLKLHFYIILIAVLMKTKNQDVFRLHTGYLNSGPFQIYGSSN